MEEESQEALFTQDDGHRIESKSKFQRKPALIEAQNKLANLLPKAYPFIAIFLVPAGPIGISKNKAEAAGTKQA
jgi:hypothetical protein